MHPRAAADFATLRAELDAWRRGQVARIKAAGLDAVKEQVGPSKPREGVGGLGAGACVGRSRD